MSGLLAKLLGRKPATAEAIGAEVEARRAAHARAEATVAAAARARAEALNECDIDGMARAEADGAAAGRIVEASARALEVLADAHRKAVEAERRRNQAAAAAVLTAEGNALAAEFRAEHDRAANVLACLRHRAALHDLKIENAVFAGAIASDAVPAAEDFRGAVRFVHSMPAVVGLDGSTLWPAPLPESDRARAERESNEEQARRKAEREAKRAADVAARDAERAAERQAERDAEDARAKRAHVPYYR